jgi:hypothetical protein
MSLLLFPIYVVFAVVMIVANAILRLFRRK